jgi:hypothetical protein
MTANSVKQCLFTAGLLNAPCEKGTGCFMNEISVTAFHYAESFCFGLLPGIVNAQNAAYNRLASEISSAFNADKPNG